jgi:hypothetical protein
MLYPRRFPSLLCGTALIACAETSAPADAFSPISSGPQFSLSASGPSASGSGVLIQQPSGAMRTFTFHARVMPDGSVEGEYDNHNRQGGFVNHGDVDCLRFIGENVAVMSGPVTRSTNPAAVMGSVTIFLVEDNGEGAETPDRISLLAIFPPGSTLNCMTLTPLSAQPIVGGNVQVHP